MDGSPKGILYCYPYIFVYSETFYNKWIKDYYNETIIGILFSKLLNF